MSLNWNFNEDKMGFLLFEDDIKKNIYNGNAFCIILNEWTEEDGTDVYSMYNFYADETHAKRCLGIDKNYKDTYGQPPIFAKDIETSDRTYKFIKAVLYKNTRNAKALAKLLLEAGITVQLVNE